VLVIVVCVDMVQYTAEQSVFLYESYVKCSSARKCRIKFRRKFLGITGASTTCLLVHFWTRNLVYKRRVFTDEIGAKLEHTTVITKTPCTRDRHLEIVTSQNDEAVELRPYRATVVHALQPRDPASRINFCDWFLQ
jgi:hypothetical protein